MPRMLTLAATLIAGLSTACNSAYQIRGTEPELKRTLDLDEVETNFEEQVNLDARSVERYRDVSLGIIELTDEGTFNPRQKDQVMGMLRADAQEGALIVIFVHGWHQGPRVCDRDLACFRRVLQALHNPAAHPRTIGIYLGWRGESIVISKVNVATLWSRKAAAQHIGRTGAKELLIEIEQVAAEIKERGGPERVTMVSVGHSLGGAMLFSAVRGKMIGNLHGIRHSGIQVDNAYRVVRAVEDRTDAGEEKALRARFGDLVVLVNPAIEATAFYPIYNDMPDATAPQDLEGLIKRRLPYDKHRRYSKNQLPILMTIASKADTAVGVIFPVSQVLRNLVRPWLFFGPKTDYRGMGHYRPHITHTLTLDTPEPETSDGAVTQKTSASKSRAPACPAHHESNVDDCQCSKSYPSAIADGGIDFGSGSVQQFDGLRFESVRKDWDTHSPYYVVQTDCHVIGEHSDIFNERLVTFLSRFVAFYTSQRKGASVSASTS